MQAPLALCDDAADEKEWTFIVAETEKLVITGKIEKESICVRKIAAGGSITSGGYHKVPLRVLPRGQLFLTSAPMEV